MEQRAESGRAGPLRNEAPLLDRSIRSDLETRRECRTQSLAHRARPRSAQHPVPAVDADGLAGDVAGVVGGEENDSAGDVLGFAEPPERDPVDEALLARLAHRLPLL